MSLDDRMKDILNRKYDESVEEPTGVQWRESVLLSFGS